MGMLAENNGLKSCLQLRGIFERTGPMSANACRRIPLPCTRSVLPVFEDVPGFAVRVARPAPVVTRLDRVSPRLGGV
jgi:hypothetical protein